MWLERGDIVTIIRTPTPVTGRIIRVCTGCPKAVVRYLEPLGGYRFISEQIHFDDMRHATDDERREFVGETRKRIAMS
jgi:hypothetical protein